MRRLLLAASLLALLSPAAAFARGTIAPTTAAAGASERFVLTMPTSLAGGSDVVGVEVTLPDGVILESGEGNQPRWQVSVSGDSVVWRGGPVESPSEDFAFRATMPEVEGEVNFQGRELYADGAGPPFPLLVVVTPAGRPGPDAAASSDDALAWIAIALAATALLLALAAVAVALSLRRLRAADPAAGAEAATDG